MKEMRISERIASEQVLDGLIVDTMKAYLDYNEDSIETEFYPYPEEDDPLVSLAPVFDLPVICVEAVGLAEGWEKSVLELWRKGTSIPTQYDRECDPASRDATLMLAVAEPFSEPRVHRCFPGGIEDLEIYTQEVVNGIHDSWIDPIAGKWSYTYSQRLNRYEVGGEEIDQLSRVVEMLVECGYTRRAQAIIWRPEVDLWDEHCPCLQRLHFRIINDRLVMSASMRSNDSFKAAYMNMFAFTMLQKDIAGRVSKLSGRDIKVGQYNHIVDSFHLYGSYFEEFEGFLRSIENRTWEQRTYRTEDVQEIMDEARAKLYAKTA